MSIEDVLIGENTVLVKREDAENVEVTKVDDSTVRSDPEHLSDEVVAALENRGFGFQSQFPMEVELHFHDEAEPYDRRNLADELGLDEEHETVEIVANLGYEISVTVEFQDENTWQVTEVFGHELKEPYSF